MQDPSQPDAKAEAAEASENFVDVELNEAPSVPVNASTADLGSLRTSYKRGPRWWKSQVAIGIEDSDDTPEPNNSASPRPRRHSTPGSSSMHESDSEAETSSVQHRVSSTPVKQSYRVPKEAPYSSTPAQRKAQGRYRSRLEQPLKRPSLLRLATIESNDGPEGVKFDPTLEPGVSMTVADDNGELYIVCSPKPPLSPAIDAAPNSIFAANMDKALAKLEKDRFSRSEGALVQNSALAKSAKAASSQNLSMDEPDSSVGTACGPNSPTKRSSVGIGRAQLPIGQETKADESSEHAVTSAPTGMTGSVSADTKEVPPPVPEKSVPSNLTRMRHLPPKSRKEEARHLADFMAMMKQSKLTERKREEERGALLRKREEEAAQTRRVWDQEILPCWTRARQEPRYKAMWWQGIPQPLRVRLWPRASGNNLMLPHDLFERASKEAQHAWSQGAFPTPLCDAIDSDIASTLPSLRLFDHEEAPMYHELRDMLYAYAYLRADEASQRLGSSIVNMKTLSEQFVLYVPGSSSLAAMLLLNLSPSQAFLAMLNIIASNAWLKAIYQLDLNQANNADASQGNQPATKQVQGFERVFNTLMAEQLPNVYANLHKSGVRTSDYLRRWIRTLFVPWVDIDTAMRIWDVILLDETGSTVFRVALALVQLLESRLYVHDRNELLSILHGTNPSVLHVWRRSQPSLTEEGAPSDRIYAQYCIDERALFQTLGEQNRWWRDSTLRRLLDRELS